LLLAIADDGLGLLILTLFYHTRQGSMLVFAGLVLMAIVISLIMRRIGISSFWPYVAICGGISWLGFYLGGVHPALAMVPIVFAMPHAPLSGKAVGRKLGYEEFPLCRVGNCIEVQKYEATPPPAL